MLQTLHLRKARYLSTLTNPYQFGVCDLPSALDNVDVVLTRTLGFRHPLQVLKAVYYLS